MRWLFFFLVGCAPSREVCCELTSGAFGVAPLDVCEGAGGAPIDAEVCGPLVLNDDRTMFLAIQHPGESAGSTFERPSTRWPDFENGTPPRPSVIALVKKDGGIIGS